LHPEKAGLSPGPALPAQAERLTMCDEQQIEPFSVTATGRQKQTWWGSWVYEVSMPDGSTRWLTIPEDD